MRQSGGVCESWGHGQGRAGRRPALQLTAVAEFAADGAPQETTGATAEASDQVKNGRFGDAPDNSGQ